MEFARTKRRGKSYDSLFERLEDGEEGEGNDGGVGDGVPDGYFRGIGGQYRAGGGDEAEGKDNEGGEEFHVGNGVVVDGGMDAENIGRWSAVFILFLTRARALWSTCGAIEGKHRRIFSFGPACNNFLELFVCLKLTSMY
jgi:hypothetical protein